jgi:predicted DNA-binding transcriptional regulator YafY
MNRTDRLMGIVALLQSKKYLTAEAIAERYRISVRTVFRDLRAMAEIGVPIAFEPGQGYYIVNGYFLPPVSLSMEEANALALMEPIVLRFADRSIQQHFETALTKIKLVLSKAQREKLEQTQAQTAHFLPEIYQHLLPETSFLSPIQNAINNQVILRLDYENAEGDRSRREVEAIGLTFYSLNWHLIAWCHLRQEYRDFRISRIKHLTATMMPFRKTDHLSLHAFLKQLENSGQTH